jgi:C4-dicarboxylate-specific signal transduction histidine kinase
MRGTETFSHLIQNLYMHGGPEVNCIRLFCHEDPEGLTLVDTNNGVGIPPELKQTLFDPDPQKRKGYGLSIVLEILSITGMTLVETGDPSTRGVRF